VVRLRRMRSRVFKKMDAAAAGFRHIQVAGRAQGGDHGAEAEFQRVPLFFSQAGEGFTQLMPPALKLFTGGFSLWGQTKKGDPAVLGTGFPVQETAGGQSVNDADGAGMG